MNPSSLRYEKQVLKQVLHHTLVGKRMPGDQRRIGEPEKFKQLIYKRNLKMYYFEDVEIKI